MDTGAGSRSSAATAAGEPADLGRTAPVPPQPDWARGPRRRRPNEIEPPPHLPARMLNEFVYCPRLFYYEWVEGLFAHSADTVEGAQRHEKIDRKSDPLPAPEGGPERFHARSVELASDALGIIAKIDLVEGSGNRVTPVDYKKGAPRETPEGPEASIPSWASITSLGSVGQLSPSTSWRASGHS